ncbi:sialate O-acetylesterase [Wenyingzhuangia sp. 1_MG-2023]|nr:sialate O-acetylesterase [Wenyingzhuangia sp. 1_MG-2023]
MFQKSKKKSFVLFSLFIVLASFSSFANHLELGPLFKEHMVLQRNIPINIWGTSLPNSLVSVSLKNKSIQVKADATGSWKAVLPKFKAGGPYEFSVKTNNESIIFKDVMVGEVWICAGQSNMVWPHKNIPEIHQLAQQSKKLRTFEVPKTVAFEKQNNIKEGSWSLENPSSAVAFTFAYFLQKYADVPVGIVLTAWGSSSLEGWMPIELTEELPHFKSIMDTFKHDEDKIKRIKTIVSSKKTRVRNDDVFLRTQPNIIYNAMMHPLETFSCRGMVWYQGESNTKTKKDMLQYGESFPLWIEYLRKQWNQKEFTAIVIALPGYAGGKNKNKLNYAESPTEDSWAWMRESQYSFENMKNTYVVTTIDLGEKLQIHPKDKLPVGKRVALLAEKITLDKEGLVEGPIFKKHIIKNNEIVVFFKNSKGLKTNNGVSPKGFWIYGNDKKWHKAEARIKGRKVILKAEGVRNPTQVRYAFSAKPIVNLVNKEGLPTRPFRTDEFLD